MQQDSLTHHVAPTTPAEQPTNPQTTPNPVTTHTWPHYTAEADTLRPDPKQLKPFPADEPLTCKPELLADNYWSNGLIHIEKTTFAQKLDSISGIKLNSTIVQPTGMAGDPVPYQFKNDNFVTILLMVSFFLVTWVISRSRHFLQGQTKDFFHERQRENLFAERTQTEFRGQIFLIFQTCFVLGLLFFDFTQERQVEVFNQVSPYRILGLSVGICSLYYLLKSGLYNFVNNIFFTRHQIEVWNNSYLLCVLALGLTLLPVTLLVVYFDLTFERLTNLFLLILLIDKALLFYKCYRIFFNYRFGWMHLFLYFCTLEIAPLLILLRVLIYANSLLLTIN